MKASLQFSRLKNLVVFLFFSTQLFGQLEWEPKASLPDFGRYLTISFAINGKTYVGLGQLADGSLTNQFWEYDPSTNIWTQKANYPGLGKRGAIGFALNGKGYVGLGQSSTSGTSHSDFYEYNPTTNSWTQKANFGGGVRSTASTFTIGDTAFVGWGYNSSAGTYTNDLWMYLPTTNTWVQRASWPGGNRVTPTTFSIGQYGYAGNGLSIGLTLTNAFYKYDKNANTWSAIASMPGTNRRDLSTFVINGEAFAGGGAFNYSPASNQNDFYKYSPSSNSWTHFTSNNAFLPRHVFEIIQITDSIIYAGFGLGPSNIKYTDFWQLKLEFDTCDYYDTTFVQDTTFLTFNDTNFVAVQDTLTFTVNTASISQPDLVGMKVYPNPAGSELTIAIADYTQMSNYTLKMYNILGVEVYSQTVNSATYTINTSTIGGAGTYYLEVYDSLNAKRGRKVIIIN